LLETTGPAAALCICGLAAEAKIARAAGFSVVVGAGDRSRTITLVERAVRQANCLISFGVAGGLAPELRTGEVIISTNVVATDIRWWAEKRFRDRIADFARGIGALEGPVLGAPAILATAAQKSRAWSETRAVAVDLESDIVARIATSAGMPFAVLRSIADVAYRELPPAALIPLSEDGTPRLARVLASVLRQPRQLTSLVGLAREVQTAQLALAGPARALHGFMAAG
jgi:adenosylhomocysteine nucleosidase